jgi:hypothetical protein
MPPVVISKQGLSRIVTVFGTLRQSRAGRPTSSTEVVANVCWICVCSLKPSSSASTAARQCPARNGRRPNLNLEPGREEPGRPGSVVPTVAGPNLRLAYHLEMIATQSSGERIDREELTTLSTAIESRTLDLVLAEDLARIARRIHAVLICEACNGADTRRQAHYEIHPSD